MEILNECKTAEKANDDDLSQFAAQKLPKGPNAKCFMACFYEKIGVVRLKNSNFANLVFFFNIYLYLDSK